MSEPAPKTHAIQVNGEAREVPTGSTLAALLQLLGLRADGIAVAVDGLVVPRSALDSRVIEAAARVEILRAVGGG